MTVWSLPVLVSALVLAQTPPVSPPPDFSGTWRLASPPASRAFQDVVITQTPADVTIERSRGDYKERVTYPFAAAPTATVHVQRRRPGRAFWDGAALVVEGTRLIQGQTVNIRETRTLNTDGSEMVVESLVLVQHGYASQAEGARNYGSGRDRYVKVVR
jgi:hypothetical protein